VRLDRCREALPDFDATLDEVESSDAYYYRGYARARNGRSKRGDQRPAKAVRLSRDCPSELRDFLVRQGLLAPPR